MARVTASEEGDGAGRWLAGVSRGSRWGATVGGCARSIGAARAGGSVMGGRAGSAAGGVATTAVGAGAGVSRDDHGCVARNVAVTKTTPIATHASARDPLRGAGGGGSEGAGVAARTSCRGETGCGGVACETGPASTALTSAGVPAAPGPSPEAKASGPGVASGAGERCQRGCLEWHAPRAAERFEVLAAGRDHRMVHRQ